MGKAFPTRNISDLETAALAEKEFYYLGLVDLSSGMKIKQVFLFLWYENYAEQSPNL